jgi:Flp pilus assembly protein TadG
MLQRLKGSESGQSIVIIALAMTAIIAMAALVLDGGYAYLERRRVQNAADAAVLAGVRYLATDKSATDIRGTIDDYARRNGINSPGTSIKAYFVDADNQIIDAVNQVGTVPRPDDARGIVLKAGEQHDTFFAQVIGFPKMQVSALAQASYAVAGKAPRLLPIAVVSQTLTFGTSYTLWDSDWLDEQWDSDAGVWNQTGGKSHRGWVNFDGGSVDAADLKYWVCNGYDMQTPVPLWVNGSPGTKTSACQDANSCNVNQVVFVPIFDKWTSTTPTDGIPLPADGNGKRYYRIVSFAAFVVNPDPAKKTIQGTFQYWTAALDTGGGVNFGSVAVKLKPPINVP